MKKTKQLGFITISESTILLTIVVIGLVVAFAGMRNSAVAEFGDLAESIGSIDQSYTLTGIDDASSSTEGSCFADSADGNDGLAILPIPCSGETPVVTTVSFNWGDEPITTDTGSPRDFNTASMPTPTIASVTTLNIGTTSAFAHSHGGAVTIYIDLWGDSGWTTVYSNILTGGSSIDFNNFMTTFPAVNNVQEVRFRSDPGQNQTFHSWNTVPITLGN